MTSEVPSLRPSRQSSLAGICSQPSSEKNGLVIPATSEIVAATTALLVLLAIFLFQLLALGYAHAGRKKEILKATRCSPFFQPQALAIISGCNILKVLQSSSQGIACIHLDAAQQQTFLLITIVAISFSLAAQFIDSCLLARYDGEARGCHNVVRLQRPWLTTFGGMAILIILLMKGLEYANNLPDGIDEGVLVLRLDLSLNTYSVFKAHLRSPGLRGAIIGYSDGLFSNWDQYYLGKNTTLTLSE